MKRVLILLILMLAPLMRAQTGDSWKKLDFLLGDWIGVAGEKDTPLGPGQGAFSFQAELNRKIIVRRNAARYDSGAQHDDLMVIYLESPGESAKAIYFDTEGHVIKYAMSIPAANRVVFESDGSQPGPRYRLSYWLEGASLNGKFELAAQPGEYKTYMSWTSKRK